MAWREIMLMDCDAGMPKRVKEEYADIVTRRDALLQARAAIDEQSRRLSECELTSQALSELNDVRASKLLVWQTEIRLRDDYEAWLTSAQSAQTGLYRKAEENRNKAERAIRGELVRIGFTDGEDSERDPSRVTPAMYLAHPSVRKCVARIAEVESIQVSIETSRVNNGTMREATWVDMQAFRSKMIAAVA